MKTKLFIASLILFGLNFLNAQQWTTMAPMPTPRNSSGVAVIGNIIYVIGGANPTSNLNVVEAYDTTTNTWTTKAPMSYLRGGLVVATVNGKIYAIGGYNNTTAVNTVEEYNPSTNTWTTKANMPTARSVMSGSVINNQIYVVGGWPGNIAALEVYDPATNTWASKAACTQARQEINGALGFNGKLYFIGGKNDWITTYYQTNEVYDPNTNTWTNLANLPISRWAGSVVDYLGEIHYLGGGTGGTYTNGGAFPNFDTHYIYNTTSNTWTTGLPMLSSRAAHVAAVVGTSIYVIGGADGSGNNIALNEKYDNTSSTQTLCTKTTQPYNVNVGDAAHDGSTYAWSIAPATPSAVMTGNGTNAITIDWTNAPNGAYTLQAIETNASGCVSTAVSASINLSGTPTAPMAPATQTFCSASTVANLTATGTTLQWYDVATGGTALASTTALVTSTTYYVSQTTGTCESARTAVAVTISPLTAPTAVAQTFCTSATVANLVATGTAIKWYAALTGGTALASTTALVTGTTYYASQTVGSCESARTAVAVTITPVTAPTAAAQTFCTSATVANLVATGPAIKWYAALTGGTALASTTALVTGTTYYASQTIGTCESARTAVVVTITTATAPTAVAQTFCNSATVANLVATGTAIKWYAALTGGTALASTTALVTGTTYYASQTVGSCESARTAVAVTITPVTAPTAAAQTFCTSATVANLVATGTAIKWYAALTGGTALASTTALVNGTTYYASQTVGSCESARTAVAVTITPRTTPTFTQVAPICAGATLAALPTTSTNAVTGTWSPTVNNTATTTYTFTPTAGLCANTATMTITVNPIVTPTFTTVASSCANATLTALPTTSNNAITGTWSPALNNTITTTYTFTPTAGQCANTTTQTITITAPKVTSAISFVAPVAALPSVTIGTQVWTNKNLDVTTYRDGTAIPQVTDPTAWANLTTGAWCYYNNDTANGTTYGKLYNWYAVAGIHDTDPNTPNKILAPTGYHIPTDAEWTTLITFLGGESAAGGKMKSTGTVLWLSPNSSATNSSGFTGFPGGYRGSNSVFYGLSRGGYWWGASENGTSNAWSRYVDYSPGNAYKLDQIKVFGVSVRCLAGEAVVAVAPTVTTATVTAIATTTATTGGNVTNDGGSTLTARGVVYSTTTNPTTTLTTKTIDGTGTGTFVSSITGLTANTTYYVRAYATNSVGTSYGNEISFTTTATASNPLGITTAAIPAGTFIMGSPTTEPNRGDETQHTVTLSAFSMSTKEITCAQYAQFANTNNIEGNGLWVSGPYPTQTLFVSNSTYGLTYVGSDWVPVTGKTNAPMINVTWYGAAAFAQYAGGRLPTEAEWEYAARATTTTAFNTGACLSNSQANYNWGFPQTGCTNTNMNLPATTQNVGTYAPNAWGLYDMHGNVLEWCYDRYAAYTTTALVNPTGPTTGAYRILRGGSWADSGDYCRSALRIVSAPTDNRIGSDGFRIVF